MSYDICWLEALVYLQRLDRLPPTDCLNRVVVGLDRSQSSSKDRVRSSFPLSSSQVMKGAAPYLDTVCLVSVSKWVLLECGRHQAGGAKSTFASDRWLAAR